MKRLLALVGAGVMIGAALLVRNVFIEGDGVDLGGDGGGGERPERVLCVTELADVCESIEGLDVEVQDAGETMETLAAEGFRAGETEFDAWITLNPWPDLVDLQREVDQQRQVLGETQVLARTRLALFGPEERLAALTAECGGDPDWRCLGEMADEPWTDHEGQASWQEVDIGHSDPTRHAAGLVVLGQAVAGYFEGTDFARNDFDLDRGFRPWLRQLERAAPGLQQTADTPLEQLIQFGAASWDGVGDLETANSRDLSVVYPSPMLHAEAVIAAIGSDELDIDDGVFEAALEAAGWEPGEARTRIDAGVYLALLDEWEDATP